MNEQHLGSRLDDFLEEEGLLAEAEAVAAKRVLAFQIERLMQEQQLSKAEILTHAHESSSRNRVLTYRFASAPGSH